MPRQRFIWPDLWDDPVFGSLPPLEQVLYIGCFSLADDEGRLRGDPGFLKISIFPRSSCSQNRVLRARDHLVGAMHQLELYMVNGMEYLAFLNWSKWQKPKYPKASKLPIPPSLSGNASPNGSGIVPEHPPEGVPSLGLGLGLGYTPLPPTSGGSERSRAKGTNPRALSKRAEAQAHQDLLDRARTTVEALAGEPLSFARFDRTLEDLEAETHASFSALERDDLWDLLRELSAHEVPF